MSSVAENTEFKITNLNLYVPIATLSNEGNVKLSKQLSEGFERSVYWNQYKTEIRSENANNKNPLRILLDASFQRVTRLFVLAFDDTYTKNNDVIVDGLKRIRTESHQKYFLPRVNMTNYNVLVDGRNFCD